MNQEELIRQVMTQVMDTLKNETSATPATQSTSKAAASTSSAPKVTREDYPLAKSMADKIKSSTGTKFTEFSLEKVLNGQLTAEDFRIAPETLEMQAQVAESANRPQLGLNMRRAAELIAVPDDELLAAYDALRPYRKSKAELLELADHLESQYGCTTNAAFIREAAEVYEKRGRLRREDD